MKFSPLLKKILKWTLFILVIFLLILFFLVFVGRPPQAKQIKWGVNFSQKHAELMGLNWRQNYLALLDDLKVRRIKLITHWDKLEPEKGKYDFADLDWQMEEAKKRGVQILLVIGMKTPRWPECHIPYWAENLSKEAQQERVIELVGNTVFRYKDYENIWAWQVENEPFFPFGKCKWYDKSFLEKEIQLTRILDDKARPIVISDSGENSLWLEAARLGDIVGTTLYKKVWFEQVGIYVYSSYPEIFYWRKAELIKTLFGKKVICVELQAEPWGPILLYDLPSSEQKKTMNLEQFKRIINFSRRTGFDEFYLWGGEWWYWLKETQNKPEIWNYARELFKD